MELDDRNIDEWVKDQGLDVVRKPGPKITVKWVKKYNHAKKPPDIKVSKTIIRFSPEAFKTIGTPYVRLGVGKERPVLGIRPSTASDAHAYKIGQNSAGNYRLSGKALIDQLLAAGLVPGEYRLEKAKSDFIAVREDKQ